LGVALGGGANNSARTFCSVVGFTIRLAGGGGSTGHMPGFATLPTLAQLESPSAQISSNALAFRLCISQPPLVRSVHARDVAAPRLLLYSRRVFRIALGFDLLGRRDGQRLLRHIQPAALHAAQHEGCEACVLPPLGADFLPDHVAPLVGGPVRESNPLVPEESNLSVARLTRVSWRHLRDGPKLSELQPPANRCR
jgi:hypothetical protein